ncbi:MAG: RNA polymerase sigma factor [Luteimonas sp.]
MTAPTTVVDLLERRYQALRRYALRRAGSPAMADDVMQDVWLRLAGGNGATRADAAPVRNPEAYLCRVIDNLVIDRQRQITARGRHLSSEPVPEEIASETPEPFRVVLGQQEYALLREAVRDLPDKCRQVFLLYRGRDMSMKQVARQLGISPKTVENHLAHAMAHCRRRLREAGRQV